MQPASIQLTPYNQQYNSVQLFQNEEKKAETPSLKDRVCMNWQKIYLVAASAVILTGVAVAFFFQLHILALALAGLGLGLQIIYQIATSKNANVSISEYDAMKKTHEKDQEDIAKYEADLQTKATALTQAESEVTQNIEATQILQGQLTNANALIISFKTPLENAMKCFNKIIGSVGESIVNVADVRTFAFNGKTTLIQDAIQKQAEQVSKLTIQVKELEVKAKPSETINKENEQLKKEKENLKKEVENQKNAILEAQKKITELETAKSKTATPDTTELEKLKKDLEVAKKTCETLEQKSKQLEEKSNKQAEEIRLLNETLTINKKTHTETLDKQNQNHEKEMKLIQERTEQTEKVHKEEVKKLMDERELSKTKHEETLKQIEEFEKKLKTPVTTESFDPAPFVTEMEACRKRIVELENLLSGSYMTVPKMDFTLMDLTPFKT